MAQSNGVWGIEVGQSALKALRCRNEKGTVVADSFDYIEYPKILSQPGANADELIDEALRQFLDQNDTRGDKICVSVPGQSGLAKFFKPPPVEVKKVADIVRYEAKQQIPFDLDDVVWDFQMMPGSLVEEGFAMESEVGLFAMKREQAYRVLEPFDEVEMEVDLVQMAPMALYNMLTHDRMQERLESGIYDSDNPPESTVLLSIGTDSSDLIVSNGFRIWQRSMPIGGNHFTRQLSKDLKLTFAKAEHLKRNAREAVDPKLVFQTMRPVFNDLVTEVQRSIGFFRSLNKKAAINDLLLAGNTTRLPGLASYLGKNLGMDVHQLDRFNHLEGDEVLGVPTFKDNASTFGVCYGLCLQGLGLAELKNSLVPREILTQRLIRAKKPWALAGLAALIAGLSANYYMTESKWDVTREYHWEDAERTVATTNSTSSGFMTEDESKQKKLDYLKTLGREVSGNAERRVLWPELLIKINDSIPRGDYKDGKVPMPSEMPIDQRVDVEITSIESKHYEDLKKWFKEPTAEHYRKEMISWSQLTNNPFPGTEPDDPNDPNEKEKPIPTAKSITGPTGEGWVIELKGYHHMTSAERMGFERSNHLRRTLLTNFMKNPVTLPVKVNGQDQMMTFTPEEIGVTFPILMSDTPPISVEIDNPEYEPPTVDEDDDSADTAIDPEDPKLKPKLTVKRQHFNFQFVWAEKTLSERLEEREKKLEEERKKNPNRSSDANAGDDVAVN
ncbi:MAG: type IV pilus assembly protein PilM [Planctomycetota bacterium]